MTAPQVVLQVPAEAGYVGLLRATVGAFAARAELTLDQVDDLRMAAEEVAVQLLRKTTDAHLLLELACSERRVQVRLSATVRPPGPVIDPESFSWMILRALTDELVTEDDQDIGAVTLAKQGAALTPVGESS